MLRGKPRFLLTVSGGASGLPPTDSAFATEPERPPGIRFYRSKESFFLPYSLLHTMRWQGQRITLTFVHDDVVIEGEGLHALYVELAEFKVARIREQEDGKEAPEKIDVNTIHVTKIERSPRD